MSEIEFLIIPRHLLFPVSINANSVIPVAQTEFLDIILSPSLSFILIPNLLGNQLALLLKYTQNLKSYF